MKRLFVLILVLIVGLIIFSACSSEKKAEEQAATQTEAAKTEKVNITPDMLATPVDLACGMDLKNHEIADTAIYKGKVYGFCSSDCKATFKANPDSFLAKMPKMEEMEEKMEGKHEMGEKEEKTEGEHEKM